LKINLTYIAAFSSLHAETNRFGLPAGSNLRLSAGSSSTCTWVYQLRTSDGTANNLRTLDNCFSKRSVWQFARCTCYRPSLARKLCTAIANADAFV